MDERDDPGRADPSLPEPGPGTPLTDPEPAPPNDEAQRTEDAWTAYWAARAGYAPQAVVVGPTATPASTGPEPAPPTWTRTYELPSARSVVSAGLQLAATSSRPIRQASLYVGLLALGALGPTVLFVLLWLSRLLTDPVTAGSIASDPVFLFMDQPGLIASLELVYFLGLVGLLLVGAISIDASAIAIALLGGVASEAPMRLFEAVTRARQVFWRLVASGLLVGLLSTVITLVISLPFLRPFDSNTSIQFVASMIATLAVVPFAYSAAGIVLGDVGAIESLRRSWRLFRFRPRIALVVVLFTLVTSVIQQLAIGSGADVAVRVADALGIGLDEGGLSLIVPIVLVLAFVMAFGSLTCTIAAIVAAPQVRAFLGLTFYSGGLDRARSTGTGRPRGFRWITRKMLASMVLVAAMVAINLPAIAAFEPNVTSQVLQLVRGVALSEGALVNVNNDRPDVEDPAGDVTGGSAPTVDIRSAGYAILPVVPDWLLADLFDCGNSSVVCADLNVDAGRIVYARGAYLFVLRTDADRSVLPSASRFEWGLALAPSGTGAPLSADDPFGGAKLAVHTVVAPEASTLGIREVVGGAWTDMHTYSRSTWLGDLLITIIPVNDITTQPLRWDAFVTEPGPGGTDVHDALRASALDPLQPFASAPIYRFFGGFAEP